MRRCGLDVRCLLWLLLFPLLRCSCMVAGREARQLIRPSGLLTCAGWGVGSALLEKPRAQRSEQQRPRPLVQVMSPYHWPLRPANAGCQLSAAPVPGPQRLTQGQRRGSSAKTQMAATGNDWRSLPANPSTKAAEPRIVPDRPAPEIRSRTVSTSLVLCAAPPFLSTRDNTVGNPSCSTFQQPKPCKQRPKYPPDRPPRNRPLQLCESATQQEDPLWAPQSVDLTIDSASETLRIS